MEHYTKYEIARMIGARALQISMGAPFLIKIKDDELEKLSYNPINIAKKELAAEALPITVRRVMPAQAQKQQATEESIKAEAA